MKFLSESTQQGSDGASRKVARWLHKAPEVREDGHIGQGKRTESPETNPRIHSQLHLSKDAKTIQRGEKGLFEKRGRGNWTSTCK